MLDPVGSHLYFTEIGQGNPGQIKRINLDGTLNNSGEVIIANVIAPKGWRSIHCAMNCSTATAKSTRPHQSRRQ
ncbi:MAG: hypothetical protein R2867_22200 [Caldilineaceae bacterium]